MVGDKLTYGLARIGNGLLSLLLLVYLTRNLSSIDYGNYALSISCITFISSVFFGWIVIVAGRFSREYASDVFEGVLARLYVLSFVAMAVLGFVLYGFFWNGHGVLNVILILAGAALLGLFTINAQMLNVRILPKWYSISSLLRLSVYLLLVVSIVYIGYELGFVLLAFSLACFVAIIARSQFNIFKFYCKRSVSIDYKELLLFSLPLAVAGIATAFVDTADRLLIGKFLGPSYVGGYAAGYDLSQQVVGAIMNIFFLVYYPRLIKLVGENGFGSEDSLLLLSVFLRDLYFFGLILVAIFLNCAGEISRLLFGSSVASVSESIMGFVVVGIFLNCLKTYYFDLVFLLSKRTWITLLIVALMAILTLVMNYLLIPIWGMFGAGIAVVSVFLIGLIMSWFFGRSFFRVPLEFLYLLRMLFCVVVVFVLCSFVEIDNDYISAVAKMLIIAAVFSVAWIMGRKLKNDYSLHSNI